MKYSGECSRVPVEGSVVDKNGFWSVLTILLAVRMMRGMCSMRRCQDNGHHGA